LRIPPSRLLRGGSNQRRIDQPTGAAGGKSQWNANPKKWPPDAVCARAAPKIPRPNAVPNDKHDLANRARIQNLVHQIIYEPAADEKSVRAAKIQETLV